jgi:phage tail-like protein
MSMQSNATSRNDAGYPLPVYNFRVEIGGVTIACSEVSGLSIGYETTTYKESRRTPGHAGPRVVLMPAQATIPTLTIKKGMVRRDSVAVLYNWLRTVQINKVMKMTIYVRLLDERGKAVISWKVQNAFPTKLDAPTFDASSNDVAIESLELTADAISVEET